MLSRQGSASEWVQGELKRIKDRGLFRRRLNMSSAQSTQVEIAGQSVLNFCSNDYLGLASDPRLVSALQEAAADFGVGSGASPLVCGRTDAHEALEQELARLTGRDRAVVFSSGYLANLAVVSALVPGRGARLYQDRLNHASLLDAALLSRAKLTRYAHRDYKSLEKSLAQHDQNYKFVLTDSVFSMDGDMASLALLSRLCQAHGALLAIDDAHGFGVLGAGGSLLEAGIDQYAAPLMMATLGKAVGCAGAFVAGPADLIELLVQKGRTYIYSTALAPALAATATRSLAIVRDEQWRRDHLAALVSYFRESANAEKLPLLDSSSPIQPLLVGSAQASVEISRRLLEKGILVTAIRPPTVPANTSRLRITLSAGHTREDIDRLIEALLDIIPGHQAACA